MFTLQQIKETHSRVKSGADFPKYVQEMRELGVLQYSQYVTDGNTIYSGTDTALHSPAKYAEINVADHANPHKLSADLKRHQAGHTDFITFCNDAAAAGVEKWTVDMVALTCTYYDKSGAEMVKENIPAV